ncbi:MAG: hypothetical protein U1E76_26965 [Planctomycetota bacterium]
MSNAGGGPTVSGVTSAAANRRVAGGGEQLNRSLALAFVLSLLLVGLYVTSTRPATMMHRELTARVRDLTQRIDDLRERDRYLSELRRALEVDATTVERVYRQVYSEAAEPGEQGAKAPGNWAGR